MNKIGVLIAMMLMFVPAALAVDIGAGIGIRIGTEDFKPIVWMCGNRVLIDDPVNPGENGVLMTERINNYAFEGESIAWDVVVFDKNGAEKISDVYGTIGPVQGEGNDIEVNCDQIPGAVINFPACNARLDEEAFTAFDDNVMEAYRCMFTVETPNSMQGEYFLTVEAEDLDGLLGIFDENEYWYFNPEIELYVSESALDFGDSVRPGTLSYSQTLLLGNNVISGSGVMLDMYIAGTDFYDMHSSGALCPATNRLDLNPIERGLITGVVGQDCETAGPIDNRYCMPNQLGNPVYETGIAYYVTNGAYSTAIAGDLEGYLPITYGNSIAQSQRIIDGVAYDGAQDISAPGVSIGNILAPGAEMAMIFRLGLPESCNGDFNTGDIFFWGEAI